jgi:hypothetical protein
MDGLQKSDAVSDSGGFFRSAGPYRRSEIDWALPVQHGTAANPNMTLLGMLIDPFERNTKRGCVWQTDETVSSGAMANVKTNARGAITAVRQGTAITVAPWCATRCELLDASSGVKAASLFLRKRIGEIGLPVRSGRDPPWKLMITRASEKISSVAILSEVNHR